LKVRERPEGWALALENDLGTKEVLYYIPIYDVEGESPVGAALG
jgi:hypothetical protein